MKEIILSHYTVKDIDPVPWHQTWDTLKDFAERLSPKLAPMDIKLKLRKVILDEMTDDALMSGNTVTIKCPDLKVRETPLEDLIMVNVDYAPCEGCATPDGVNFACRTFKDPNGATYQAIPEEYFMEATLRVAFKAQHDSACGGNCDSCASGCGDEEQGTHPHGTQL